MSHVVTIHIVRRDPLSQPHPINSPLVGVSSRFNRVDISTAIPTQKTKPESDIGIVAIAEKRKKNPPTQSTAHKTTPVKAANGEDVSDYV